MLVKIVANLIGLIAGSVVDVVVTRWVENKLNGGEDEYED